jgi:DHA2 family multidrug resistance protein
MLKRYETETLRAPIDTVGLALLVVFVSALQLMLDLGKEHDWFESTEICALAIVAIIGFIAFLIWELTERHPIVDLRVFRHRGFTTAVITIAMGYGSIFGMNVLTPLWLQSFMGYTATWAGLVTGWSGVLAVLAAPAAGMLIAKVDPRRLIFFGLMWLGVVTLSRSFLTTDASYWQIAAPIIFMGIGLPFFFVPVTALALGNVEEHEMAAGAGLQNFLRTLSGAVATSVVQTAWENRGNDIHARLVGDIDRTGETVATLAAGGMNADQQRQVLDNLLTSQSVMIATNHLMFIVALICCAGAFLIWLAPRPTRAVDMTKAGH